MNPTLNDFHRIISSDLKPWVSELSNDRYKVLTKELVVSEINYIPSYSLDFIKSFSPKSKYYEELMKNEVTNYLNDIGSLFFGNESENIRINVIFHSLQKEILPLLKKTNEVIESEKYKSDYINIKSLIKSTTEVKENTFILHFLKAQLIAMYLEIQNLGEDYLQTDFLEMDDLYFQIFNEEPPTFYSIEKVSDNPSLQKTDSYQPRQIKKEESGFKPILGDLEGVIETLVTYDNISNQEEFAKVEDELHYHKIIDMEYHFIKSKKESNSRNLAAILKVLIDSNYFRRNIIGSKRKADDNDIRKFIEARYSCNIQQQFTKLKPEHIEAAKRKYYWLTQINPLR